MGNRLFGTDGVRGTAGEPPLDPETIARLGAALVRVLPHKDHGRILVGRDTRESGAWIEQALARGIRSESANLVSAGVIPTPGVAYLTRSMDFDAGVVISASHNPFQDNGIKVFSGRGEKFDEAREAQIEALIHDASFTVDTTHDVAVDQQHDLVAAYARHQREVLPDAAPILRGGAGRGTRIALDCANGATTTVAPRLFRDLGFDVTVIGGEPDGRNINLHCGSTHPDKLQALVREDGYRLGVAFDGDGDRAILVDHAGNLVDGDAVMLMCAKHMQAQRRLRGNAVVATVMSNIGLELALRALGIELVRAPVGDKYVMEEIIKRDLSLGGEQSGHVIFSDYLFTGDGITTALSVLRTMVETGKELAELAADLKTFPQVLVNVRVKEKRELKSVPDVAAVLQRIEQRLDGQGRLLVRYSGTEPLLRIMIEGQDQHEIQTWANEIADVVRRTLA
jgi:phosphoglucosamine mutase